MSLDNIREGIDTILRSLGFVRRKTTWNRRSGAFIDVIDLQVSKSGDMVTMNAGVLHGGVHRNTWGTDVPTFVDEPSSTVRARLSQLTDGKQTWWPIESSATKSDLTVLLRTHVVPFLESMHSDIAMEQYLGSEQVGTQSYPLPRIHIALLRYERGDKAGACALLSDMKSNTSGAWQNRVEEVAKRIGCE